jgi:hypothetical protein
VEAGGFVLALNTPDPRDKKPATLVVFEAKDGDYVEKARYKAADSPAWAHPVISGKSIYVKDATKLTQWILP